MEAEGAEFADWLSAGNAAGMEYLKRNPQARSSPAALFAGARSALVVSASYYTDLPSNPGAQWGRVARYAVGQDYHTVLSAKLSELKCMIEGEIGRPLLSKAFSDNVALFEQAYARRAGLGFVGRNTLVISGKTAGSYQYIAELFTDLELEPDEPIVGSCGGCFRCAESCPTGAISRSGVLNAGACVAYLTIENKGGIPLEHRAAIGERVFGCDICQEVCPYNKQPPEARWKEFHSHSGVGHYLDLVNLLAIGSQDEFKHKFAHSPLLRPRRRGLIRNALVVLGNLRPDSGLAELTQFALNEPDIMLREHAAWAVAQYGDECSGKVLDSLYQREEDPGVKSKIADYKEQMGTPIKSRL